MRTGAFVFAWGLARGDGRFFRIEASIGLAGGVLCAGYETGRKFLIRICGVRLS